MTDNRARRITTQNREVSCFRFRPHSVKISDYETGKLETCSLKKNSADVDGSVSVDEFTDVSCEGSTPETGSEDDGSGELIQDPAQVKSFACRRWNYQDSRYTLLSPEDHHANNSRTAVRWIGSGPENSRRTSEAPWKRSPSGKLKNRKGLVGYIACCRDRLSQRLIRGKCRVKESSRGIMSTGAESRDRMKECLEENMANSETVGMDMRELNISQEPIVDSEWRKAIVPYYRSSGDDYTREITVTKCPSANVSIDGDGRGPEYNMMEEAAKQASDQHLLTENGWNQATTTWTKKCEKVESDDQQRARTQSRTSSLRIRSPTVTLQVSTYMKDRQYMNSSWMEQIEDVVEQVVDTHVHQDGNKSMNSTKSQTEVLHWTCLAALPLLQEFQDAVRMARLQMRIFTGYLVVEEDIRTTCESHHFDRMQLLARIMKAGPLQSPLTLFVRKPWHIKYVLDACANLIFFSLEQPTMCCEGCRSRKCETLIFDYQAEGFDWYVQSRGRTIEALVGYGMESWSETLKRIFVSCAMACFRVHTLVTTSGCRYAVKVLHPVRGDRFDASTMDTLDTVEADAVHPKVLFTIFSGFMLQEGEMMCMPQVYLEPKMPSTCI